MSNAKQIDDSFAGKIVVIIGASGGIGKCTAELFAASGAKVIVTASTDLDKAKAVASAITDRGQFAYPKLCNVRKVSEINALFDEVLSEFGTVDILVNSAGADLSTPLGDTTEDTFDRVLETNFKGVFFAINAVAPIMKKAGYGKIISISSISETLPWPAFGAWCSAKSAVNVLTRVAARELGPYGINCNAVGPGQTIHGHYEVVKTDPNFQEYRDWVKRNTPLPRQFLAAEDIASAILFLAADRNSGITGVTIPVDLGMATGIDAEPIANVLTPQLIDHS